MSGDGGVRREYEVTGFLQSVGEKMFRPTVAFFVVFLAFGSVAETGAQEVITDQRSCQSIVGGTFTARSRRSLCTLVFYTVVETRHIVVGERIELVVNGDFRNLGTVTMRGQLDLKGASLNRGLLTVEQNGLFVNNGVIHVEGGTIDNRGETWNAVNDALLSFSNTGRLANNGSSTCTARVCSRFRAQHP